MEVDLLAHLADDEDIVNQRFTVGCGGHTRRSSTLARSLADAGPPPRSPPTLFPIELSASLPRWAAFAALLLAASAVLLALSCTVFAASLALSAAALTVLLLLLVEAARRDCSMANGWNCWRSSKRAVIEEERESDMLL